jgi:hypothetical protein
MAVEYWAWYYDENPNKRAEEFEDDEFDMDEVLASMENNPDDWAVVTEAKYG